MKQVLPLTWRALRSRFQSLDVLRTSISLLLGLLIKQMIPRFQIKMRFQLTPIYFFSCVIVHKVQFVQEDRINRDSLTQNEKLIIQTLNHLGTRVCVQTLEVHIESFYCLMNIPVPRDMTSIDILLSKYMIVSHI